MIFVIETTTRLAAHCLVTWGSIRVASGIPASHRVAAPEKNRQCHVRTGTFLSLIDRTDRTAALAAAPWIFESRHDDSWFNEGKSGIERLLICNCDNQANHDTSLQHLKSVEHKSARAKKLIRLWPKQNHHSCTSHQYHPLCITCNYWDGPYGLFETIGSR